MKSIRFFLLILFLFKANFIFSQNVCVDKTLTEEQTSSDAESAAFLVGRSWERGKTLTVKILGGSAFIQDKVKKYAIEWEDYANLKFKFVSGGNADIRVSFIEGKGSWSYVGTDAKKIPQDQPTMNFGWFNYNTSDTEFRRTTLHEFGHAIGLIHEHQHPKNPIPWNKPVVYAYYLQTQGWNSAQVDRQVFSKYSVTQSYFCLYDVTSIMHYPIPEQHTIGDYEVGWNILLSKKDKLAARNMYPFESDYNPYWTGAGNSGKWYIGDFNGDGKDDIFRYVAGKSGAEVFLSTGENFTSAGSWTSAGNSGKWYIGDFNGDGRSEVFRNQLGRNGVDVLLSTGSSLSSLESWCRVNKGDQDWFLGDFNGDGKTDIFRYKNKVAGAHMFLSNGSQFFSSDEDCNF